MSTAEKTDVVVADVDVHPLSDADHRLVVVGDYEVDTGHKLGEGSHGAVYKGRRVTDGHPVAVKIVQTPKLQSDELRSIAKAQCDCVVRLIDLIRTDTVTYFLMELCDMDLNAYLDAYGRLHDANLRRVAECLADGYLVLYRHKIVHRDIKSHNILVNIDHQNLDGCRQPTILSAKFTDFGCSRLTDGDDYPANLAGSFYFMAPEMGANLIDSHRYNEQVDMWSIGVVLYQAMVGRAPFTEQQLCRLFLRAVDKNYVGYTAPSIGSEEKNKQEENDGQIDDVADYDQHDLWCGQIVQQLLQLNPSDRLQPIQFHDFMTNQRAAIH